MTVRVTREAEPQIEIYGAYSGELLGTGNGVRATLTFTPTDKYLILVVKGSMDKVQLEAGAFPTSYIPTTGATATRAADICSIATSAFGYNQKAGTVVVECETSNDANITASRRPYTLTGVSSQIGATFIYDNGVFDIADSGSAGGKHGTAIKSGSMAIVNNSGTPRASTASLDGGYSSGEILIGGYLSATNLLNGHIKSIAYYPRRLTNAQLQALTA